MDIRLYFLTKKQKQILGADAENVLSKCDKIAKIERDDMYEEQKRHDGICPNCRAKKTDDGSNIVNKIARVQGGGSVGGNLFGVSGSMSVDTNIVNHCNKCGNEWKKFETKAISQTNILRVCLNYLGEIFKDPTIQKKYEWKMEAISVFDDCFAETIYHFRLKESDYLWSAANTYLHLHNLRKHYKSIFDKNNKKKIEKL